ncbi:MAG TPA: hypothetical protein DF712_18105 [Balneola sp.]|nr:hypothetical protein [Balneola sp.]HCT54365.1 hypothetical protein [Balneola sp.]
MFLFLLLFFVLLLILLLLILVLFLLILLLLFLLLILVLLILLLLLLLFFLFFQLLFQRIKFGIIRVLKQPFINYFNSLIQLRVNVRICSSVKETIGILSLNCYSDQSH